MGAMPFSLVAPGWPGIIGQGGPSYLAEAKALFAAMTTQPTAARKTLINNTIVALKNAGIWSQLDVLYVLAAADSQAARINWKTPGTFDAVAVNSPTFEADRGFTGNGTSSRLRTNYTPSANAVNLQLNNASLWEWNRTDTQQGVNDIGNGVVPQCAICPRFTSDTTIVRVNDGTSTTVSNTSASGFFGGQRSGASATAIWKNGVRTVTGSVSSTSLASAEQWICGANSSQFSTHQIAGAAWAASLTGLELQFYNIMLSYMQGVGAA